MKFLEVVNLEKYQHYSDRPNVWIKWYQKSLTDYKFQQLTDSERWLFVGLIMIAVESDNTIPRDALWVYQRVLYRSPKGSYRAGIGLKKMVKLGLLREKNAIIDKEKNKRREEARYQKIATTTKRRYYQNQEMRFSKGKWWVVPKNGDKWLEFDMRAFKDTVEK